MTLALVGKGLLWGGGLTFKNRGHWGSRYKCITINTYVYIYIKYDIFSNSFKTVTKDDRRFPEPTEYPSALQILSNCRTRPFPPKYETSTSQPVANGQYEMAQV